jgi:LmbE family N-acetylglucosaminyl deacetylase
MNFYGQRVLFLGAHPDDIELGCGALLAAIVGTVDVLCVTLSDNQKNPDLTNLVDEHRRSMAILGISDDSVRFIVFAHSKSDIHQDHAVVTQEALRAFRGNTVLGFDVLRSSYGFFPQFMVEVSERDVDKKIEALAEYETYRDRYYFDPEVIRSTLVRYGSIAERPYAEGFDILRVVGKFGE